MAVWNVLEPALALSQGFFNRLAWLNDRQQMVVVPIQLELNGLETGRVSGDRRYGFGSVAP
jgi:hypothetical protein